MTKYKVQVIGIFLYLVICPSLTLFFSLLCLCDLGGAVSDDSLKLSSQKLISTQKDAQKTSAPSAEPRVQIADVVVKGVEGKLADLVRKTVRTKTGSIITRSDLQKDIDAIFETGFFSNSKATPEDTPKGVRVNFIVEVNPVLRQIELIVQPQGNAIIPLQAINSIFKQQYGDIINFRSLQVGTEKLKQWYQDHGYPAADVVGKPIISANGTVKLQVAEGIIEDIQVRFVNKDGKDKDAQGNSITGKTPITEIKKQINLQPGKIYYLPQAQKDAQKIFNFGIYDNVTITLNTDKDKNKSILVLNLTENDLAENAASFINYQEELKLAQTNKNYINEAQALRKLGKLYGKNKENYEKGIEKYQQALRIWQAKKAEIEVAKVYNNLGNVYFGQEKYEEAIPNYQAALKIYQTKKYRVAEAITLNNLGNTYRKANDFSQAVDTYQKAVEIFGVLQEPFWQTLSTTSLAFSYQKLGNNQKALDLYNQAIGQWRSLQQNPTNIQKNAQKCGTQTESQASLLFAYRISNPGGLESEALIQLEEELKNCVVDTHFWEVDTFFNTAITYQSLGDYQQAIYTLNESLKLWEAIKKIDFISNIVLTNHQKDSPESVNNQAVLNVIKPLFDTINLLAIISFYTDLGRSNQSVDLKLQVQKGLELSQAKIMELINSHKDNNSNSNSFIFLVFKFLSESLEHNTSEKGTNNAFLKTFFDDFLKVLQPQLNAQNASNKAFFNSISAYILLSTNIDNANKLAESGKDTEALAAYNQAIEIIQKTKDNNVCQTPEKTQPVTVKETKTSTVNIDLNYFCSTFSKLLNLQDKQAEYLNSKAKVLLNLKQNQQALSTLNQALLLSVTANKQPENPKKQQSPVSQIQSFQNTSSQSNTVDTQQILKKIDSISSQNTIKEQKRTTAETLYLIGKVYSANREYDKALNYYNHSLTLFHTVDAVFQEADTQLAIAMNERDQGNLIKAKAESEKALETIESDHAQTQNQEQQKNDSSNSKVQVTTIFGSYVNLAKYLASKQNYYDFYIDLLVQLDREKPSSGYDVLAFQASERSKARSLRAIFNQRRSNRANIKEANLSDREVIKLSQVSSLPEIQKQIIDDNTLILEYALGKERSYLWLVSKKGIKTYQLPKRTEIEELSRLFLEKLKSPSYSISRKNGIGVEMIPEGNKKLVANRLSEILIAPITEQLGKKRLLIVADGILQYLPFAALPKQTADKSFKPLLLEHEIVGLPSASLQALLQSNNRQKPKPKKTLVVLADPVFSLDDERVKIRAKTSSPDIINTKPIYQRLLGTREEANQIANLVPASEKLLKLDFDASYQAAINPELNQYRIVHFATHGTLDAQRPERSGVVFSAINYQNELQRGLLSVPDVFRLNLSADIVVLSGCVTALGKEIRGEGLIGLTGGFMYAGSKSVVSSLWSVDDKATAILMSKFYTNILKKGLSPAQALRTAQLEMWDSDEWQAPYFWAAFTIQGDGK